MSFADRHHKRLNNKITLIYNNKMCQYFDFLQRISEVQTFLGWLMELLMELTMRTMTMMIMTMNKEEVEQFESVQHLLLQWHFSQYYSFDEFPMMQVLKKQEL